VKQLAEEQFILDGVTSDEYETAGSKFMTVPPQYQKQVGYTFYRKALIGMMGWDTLGKSLKIPFTIAEETDLNKEDKISFGIDKKGIWKGKELYKAATGGEMPMAKGKDGNMHPAPNAMELMGKEVWVQYVNQKGAKGGDVTKGETIYPKAQAFLSYGSGERPTTQAANLGI
jgi:hypothetical protein